MDTKSAQEDRIRKTTKSRFSDEYDYSFDMSGYYDDEDEDYTSSGRSTSKGRAVIKRTWTEEEDSLLQELVEQYGTKNW